MSETVPRLFVGGPWHGQVKPVPAKIREYDQYHVPLPIEPIRFMHPMADGATMPTLRVFTYERRCMWFSPYYPPFVVMAPPNSHTDDAMMALLAAAGITPEGGNE